MAGLNNLHSLLQKEATQKDFVLVQMEQMINRDVRENTLVTLEGMEPTDQYALETGGTQDDLENIDQEKADEEIDEEGFDAMSLDSEMESLEELMGMEESAEGPEPHPGPVGEDTDPAIEALLEKIPEATEEEVTNFFSSTESDETLDHNPALEAEMVVIDMLISA